MASWGKRIMWIYWSNVSRHQLKLGRKWVFQMDNDPKHTPKVVAKWLKDNNATKCYVCLHSPDLPPRFVFLAAHSPLSQTVNSALSQHRPETWNKLPQLTVGSQCLCETPQTMCLRDSGQNVILKPSRYTCHFCRHPPKKQKTTFGQWVNNERNACRKQQRRARGSKHRERLVQWFPNLGLVL